MWLAATHSSVVSFAGAAREIAVAVPAHREEQLIGACLDALDVAASHAGVGGCRVTVLVMVNNCRDGTAAVARAHAPRRLEVVVREIELPPADAHAGGARRAALDAAAALLPANGVLMTTDADSRVDPGWIAANLAELAAGADAVAGIVTFDAAARIALPALPGRALEWRLAALHARLGTLLDPRAHDPWPTHIWAWGASFALTRAAYLAVGGLPMVPLAEDRALASALERADLRLRRSHAPVVYTSPRLDGRAPGGFADMLRSYTIDAAAPCDAALEPTADLVRRLRARARLRGFLPGEGFGEAWAALDATLGRRRLLPPALPREIAAAERLVRRLEARETRRADNLVSACAA